MRSIARWFPGWFLLSAFVCVAAFAETYSMTASRDRWDGIHLAQEPATMGFGDLYRTSDPSSCLLGGAEFPLEPNSWTARITPGLYMPGMRRFLDAQAPVGVSLCYMYVENRRVFSSAWGYRQPLPAPTEIQGFKATQGEYPKAVVLTWSPHPMATGYYVWRSVAPGQAGDFLGAVTDTRYVDSSPVGTARYYYTVAGYNGTGVGAAGTQVVGYARGVDQVERVSLGVESRIAALATYHLEITLRNAGTSTWKKGEYFLRIAVSPHPSAWPEMRLELRDETVEPGQVTTLGLYVPASATPGHFTMTPVFSRTRPQSAAWEWALPQFQVEVMPPQPGGPVRPPSSS